MGKPGTAWPGHRPEAGCFAANRCAARPLAARLSALALLAATLHAGPAPAAFQFPLTPDWQSTPQSHNATGCALRDLDHDGFPDLIVSNGNDIARQGLVVYRNQNGVLPVTPTWMSADIDYNGHLDLADVDGDGHLDCAVAVYLGPAGFGDPGKVKLYRGNGDGTFSATPVWISQDRFYCFSLSFGDVNEDGRPDLACATGESYDRQKERFRVYRNVGGALEGLPYWQASQLQYALDVTWGDVNGDGHLDLAFACESNVPGGDPEPFPSKVYFGNGLTLSTTPGWQCLDGHDYSNTVALGDLNGDGWLDLALADNNQLAGGADFGRAKVFLNDGAGHLATLPAWTSSFGGDGSHVSFIDPDGDGDLDLAHGDWFGKCRLYENQGGVLPAGPTWQSNTTSTIENIVWEDVDNDGLEPGRVESFTGDGTRSLFLLHRRPVRVAEVAVDGVALSASEYFACSEQGWLTVGQVPAAGTTVRVEYAASGDLDLAASNWDSGIGNYLFRNRRDPVAISEDPVEAPSALAGLVLAPNPSSGACRILYERGREEGRIEIFSSAGIRVFSGDLTGRGSTHGTTWDGRDNSGRPVASGSYWVRVHQGNGTAGGKLVIIR